jgi:hypothetical protein
VQYASEDVAARALHGLNGRPLRGRPLRVRALQAGDPAGAAVARPGMPPPLAGFPPPAQPPQVPPNVRAFLDSLGPAATHKLLSELRRQAIAQPEATRQQLLQFPVLAQAVVHLMARMGTLRTGTPAYSAAAGAAAAGAAAAAAAAAAQQHLMQHQMQQQQHQPLTLEERQQVEQVQGFMALSDAAVAALPPDSRPAVEQIRYALNTPVERLQQEQLTDLISLREELQKLFVRYTR